MGTREGAPHCRPPSHLRDSALQLVCLPSSWRLSILLLVVINAAVSVLVEVSPGLPAVPGLRIPGQAGRVPCCRKSWAPRGGASVPCRAGECPVLAQKQRALGVEGGEFTYCWCSTSVSLVAELAPQGLRVGLDCESAGGGGGEPRCCSKAKDSSCRLSKLSRWSQAMVLQESLSSLSF